MGHEVYHNAIVSSAVAPAPYNLKTVHVAADKEVLTKRCWRNADAVCFDVDSTVCQVSTGETADVASKIFAPTAT